MDLGLKGLSAATAAFAGFVVYKVHTGSLPASSRRVAFAVVGVMLLWSAVLAAAAYARARAMRLPRLRPATYRRLRSEAPRKPCVVCLGDSITQGSVSGDYVARLQRALGDGVEAVNAGVNSQVVQQGLKRAERVARCEPRVVTVLMGTNDAKGVAVPAMGQQTEASQRLDAPPTKARFREALRALLRRLHADTDAAIVVGTLPPLGEDLHSDANATLAEFNAVIREECAAPALRPRVEVAAVHEELVSALEDLGGGGQPFQFDNFFPVMLKAVARRYLLRQSWDAIGDAHGLRLMTDHLHLNDRGAEVVASVMMSSGALSALASSSGTGAKRKGKKRR